jgi:hypothetical protein
MDNGIPAQMPITVLPPDDPKKLRLGWYIYERSGFELPNLSAFFRNGGSLGGVSSLVDGAWPAEWRFESYDGAGSGMSVLCGNERVIIPYAKGAGDILVGDTVIVMSLMGPAVATVTKIEFPKAMAETESCLYPLAYGDDDGMCWLCKSQISKGCLNSLTRLDIAV